LSNPSYAEYLEVREFLNPTGFTFSVTIRAATGAIKRVGFYALKLLPNRFPEIVAGLATFFKEAPSYDDEEH